MSLQDWALASDRAVMFASILYGLAFLAFIGEWALARTLGARAQVPVLAAVGAGPDGAPSVEPEAPLDSTDGDRAARAELCGRIGVALTVVAVALHAAGLVTRSLATDPIRVPWGNMYEFTLAGTLGVSLIFLAVMGRYHLRWIGMLVTGFVLVILMLNSSVLYTEAGPVQPALHSYWLAIHVFAAVVASGAFAVGAILSVLYLVKLALGSRAARRPHGFISQLPELDVLDRVAYRLHAIGFPIWTFAALISGPIWAEYAWGSYWNWDPKEVWAFITWVVYAGYLHARATAGFRGRAAAIIALVGFATLLFNFVGINFFFGGDSMHSYAK